MGLYLPNSVYIHIPKTGGTTVRKLVESMDLSRGETGHQAMLPVERQHSPFEWMRGEVGDRQAFATVRPTLDWYRSQWMHKTRTGHGSGIISDENFRPDFGDWVTHVTKDHSGHYGWFLTHMLRGSHALLVRTDNLFDDLKDALERLGEDFVWPYPDQTHMMNRASAGEKADAEWTPALTSLVHGSEGTGTFPTVFIDEYEQNFIHSESCHPA